MTWLGRSLTLFVDESGEETKSRREDVVELWLEKLEQVNEVIRKPESDGRWLLRRLSK
jgi:hypothetical protein